MIIGIVAISKNFAIGRGGKLPWHYSSDLKFFKQTTAGNSVLMGRKTFESIGKALPGRLNIVLSRNSVIAEAPGLITLHTKQEVVSLCEYLKGDLFIIGGGQIYAAFANLVEKWIVTEIPEVVSDADAFLPEDFLSGFENIGSIHQDTDLPIKTYMRRQR